MLVFKILNVNSAPINLNFIYNRKSSDKHCCSQGNAGEITLAWFPIVRRAHSGHSYCKTRENKPKKFTTPLATVSKFVPLIPFRAFSYHAYLHYAPSPAALNFIMRLLLQRLVSFRTLSYGAYFHSSQSPTAHIVTFERQLKVMWMFPFSFSLKVQNISLSLTTPARSSIWVW